MSHQHGELGAPNTPTGVTVPSVPDSQNSGTFVKPRKSGVSKSSEIALNGESSSVTETPEKVSSTRLTTLKLLVSQ